MAPWWEIRYFDRKNGLKTLNSAMVPFKLLPELDKMDIRNGHKFKTDEFEIAIPGSDITLHMPSNCLWIEGKPHHVPGAKRVILFQRTHAAPDGGVLSQAVYLGLMTDDQRGLIVKYMVESKKWELSVHPNGNSPDRQAKITAPELPDLEK
jgi:hypothetical protein